MRPGPKRPRKRPADMPFLFLYDSFNEAGAEKAPETRADPSAGGGYM